MAGALACPSRGVYPVDDVISRLQTGKTIQKESPASHGYHVTAGVETLSNRQVAETIGGHEDHLGPEDLKVRRRILGLAPVQFGDVGGGEAD